MTDGSEEKTIVRNTLACCLAQEVIPVFGIYMQHNVPTPSTNYFSTQRSLHCQCVYS